MKIRLISQSQVLNRLCREVLLEFEGRTWDYGMVAGYQEARSADVLIWDVDPGVAFPEELNLETDRTNIFLVDRKDVVPFLEGHPMAALSILLKPVNERVLHDFLNHLVTRHERLRGLYAAERVGEQTTERGDMLQSLLYSNLKLQEFDQDRTNFLAQCVHEFRAPLMAVYGYCSILLNKQVGPLNSEQARILDRMRHSARRLTRLSASMFEMSMGRRIHMAPPEKPGDIEGCIAQAVYETTPLTDSKKIAVRVKKIAPERPILLAASQIEQVLVNLLENACRFTPKRGRIEIDARPIFWDRRSSKVTERRAHKDRRSECSQEANAFRIEVRDSGPGIRREDLGRIFEEFTSESAKTDMARGGLGLSICRQIIQSHRGQIFAESDDKGAKFLFILPYASCEFRSKVIISSAAESLAMRVSA
jgi:signal transduction histidine kinase